MVLIHVEYNFLGYLDCLLNGFLRDYLLNGFLLNGFLRDCLLNRFLLRDWLLNGLFTRDWILNGLLRDWLLLVIWRLLLL